MPLILPRLIWSSLAVALVVGTVQTGVQHWQAAPLILAAEVFEGQKVETSATVTALVVASVLAPVQGGAAHPHVNGIAAHEHPQAAVKQLMQTTQPPDGHDHKHGAAKGWTPENGAERIVWTCVANILHAFSMALLVFAVMGVWCSRRGAAVAALPLAALVAAAGWLSFYLWPTLGLPAQLPGMDAAPLQLRQLWSVLAVGCAAAACALVGFGNARWRWLAATVLLALPFAVGAPQLHGDALAGNSLQTRIALDQLRQQFFWATTWVAVSFWLSIGLACGMAFQRWLQSMFMPNFKGTGLVPG